MNKLFAFTLIACASMAIGQGGGVPEIVIKKLADSFQDPEQIAITKEGKVFITERSGNLKLYNPIDKSVTLVNTLNDVDMSGESGLMGMVLDPNFDANHNIFMFYFRK